MHLVDIMQTCLLVYSSMPENYYWNDAFKQFIQITGSFIAAGVTFAEYILKGTEILKITIDIVVFKKSFC